MTQVTKLLDDGYTNWGWQHSWTTERQIEFDALRRRPGWVANTFKDYEIHWNTHHKVFYRVASEDIDIEERQVAHVVGKILWEVHCGQHVKAEG